MADYVVKRVGDEYVSVPVADTDAAASRDGTLIAGAALLAMGLLRRGLLGTLSALAGAGLAYYGATGVNPLEQIRRAHSRGGPTGRPADAPSYQHDVPRSPQLPADDVDEASMESFPASDSPAR